MLYEVLKYIRDMHNFDAKSGEITISDGIVNQKPEGYKYILIEGSKLNDGIYRADGTTDNLAPYTPTDETFDGFVYGVAIPKPLLELCEKIAEWNSKYNTLESKSNLTSETFEGYSYTRTSGKNGAPITWKEVFTEELKDYRKI